MQKTAETWQEFVRRGPADLLSMDPPELTSETYAAYQEALKAASGSERIALMEAIAERLRIDGADEVADAVDVQREIVAEAQQTERQAIYRSLQETTLANTSGLTRAMLEITYLDA